MAVMMTGGIWLRSSGVAPDRFIAFFYTGLGAPLLLAGLLFGCNFAKALAEIRPAWSSFGITVSKLLFFVGKMAP